VVLLTTSMRTTRDVHVHNRCLEAVLMRQIKELDCTLVGSACPSVCCYSNDKSLENEMTKLQLEIV